MSGLTLPQCNTYKLTSTAIIRTLTYSKYIKDCDCKEACVKYHYKTYIVRRETDTARASNQSQLLIYYNSPLVEKQVEYWSYDFSQFVADAGGSMGFLLGVSVIGIVSILENAVEACLRPTEKKTFPLSEEKYTHP